MEPQRGKRPNQIKSNQLTDPRLVMPPHVFPERVQVSLDKVREVILNLRSPRRSRKNPARETDGPACRRIRIARQRQQQVVETVCAAVGATMPVRGVPETVQETLGERLVEDDEGRLGC